VKTKHGLRRGVKPAGATSEPSDAILIALTKYRLSLDVSVDLSSSAAEPVPHRHANKKTVKIAQGEILVGRLPGLSRHRSSADQRLTHRYRIVAAPGGAQRP
jgi:hypothetical protein